MPRTITTLDELSEYLDGIVDRAMHHASNVNAVLFSLIGTVLKMTKGVGALKVWTLNGKLCNAARVMLKGRRYFFSYEHDDEVIVMREDSKKGPKIALFTNADTPVQVFTFFNSLPG